MMRRNEDKTCRERIEPAPQGASWSWDRHLQLGPSRVNIAGGSMYDENQRLAVDYLFRHSRLPLGVLDDVLAMNAANQYLAKFKLVLREVWAGNV
jgi:hypothetical protein